MGRRENAPTRAILDWLSRRPNSFTCKVSAGAFQSKGLPDIYHAERGLSFWFEVKVQKSGYGVTPLQEHNINQLRAAGVHASVVTSLEEVIRVVEA